MNKKKFFVYMLTFIVFMPRSIVYAEDKPSNFSHSGPAVTVTYVQDGESHYIIQHFFDEVPAYGIKQGADDIPIVGTYNSEGVLTNYYIAYTNDGYQKPYAGGGKEYTNTLSNGIPSVWTYPFIVFNSTSAMNYYIETGTTSNEGIYSIPEGSYIDSDGSIKTESKYNDNIPTPLVDKVRFQMNTQTGKQILIDFKNIGDYAIQTMFKGEFNYKELKVLNFMSKWQYYNKTSYSYVMNEVMKDGQNESAYPLSNVQYKNFQGYPLYENRLFDVIKEDLKDINLDVGAFQALKTNVKFRFVKVDENNVPEEYGNWLLLKFNWMTESYELQELDGDPTIVINDDEDIRTNNTEIDRESNYIDVPSSTTSDYQDIETVFTSFKGLMDSMGSVPQLFSTVFQFVPQEALLFIVCGIGFIVALRFLGR